MYNSTVIPQPIFVTDRHTAGNTAFIGKTMVIRIENINQAIEAEQTLTNCTLQGFIIDWRNKNLSECTLPTQMPHNNMLIHLAGLGDLCSAFEMFKTIGKHATLIFHGCKRIIDAEITASLGMNSGVIISPDSDLSDELLDLATYHFHSPMAHGNVEPFTTLQQLYSEGQRRMQPSAAYCNMPGKYFHIDNNLNVAMTETDLHTNQHIGSGIQFIDSIHTSETLERAAEIWQRHLLQQDCCASCPAFCICSGYFTSPHCQEFMTEVLEGIEFREGGEA